MKSVLLLYWAPRVLAILAILFVSVFSLDAFRAGLPLKTQILDWLMHMVPSFVLIIILAIAWRWENIGGMIFMAIGLAFSPFIFWGNYSMNHSIWMSFFIILTITFPFILTGALFMLSHHTRKKAVELLKMLEKQGKG
ncbi:MAG: hypothetical protein NTU51_10095 [Bacteroidetes bacterium]|nr:hypothetical protein [Bacteroidota bacterium]